MVGTISHHNHGSKLNVKKWVGKEGTMSRIPLYAFCFGIERNLKNIKRSVCRLRAVSLLLPTR